jgi:hypothetical protein
MHYPKERRYRRFDFQFPVCLSFPSAGVVRKLEAVSKNVSIGGLLLKSGDQIPPHTHVSLTMDVRSPWSSRAVRLLAEGEVVRVEPLGPGAGYAIAVQCKRPIREMEDHLPAAS